MSAEGMLQEGRIPAEAAEHEAVDALLEKHGDAITGLTRRDSGNSGPLVVDAHDGRQWEIDDTGKVTQTKKKKVS